MPNRPFSLKSAIVIEDEFLILVEIEHVLRELGVERVVGLADSIKALDFIRDGGWDFAVLDVHLIDGSFQQPLASVLHEQGTPFIFCTAHSGIPQNYEAVPVLRKPFSKEDLAAAMHLALAHRIAGDAILAAHSLA